MRGGMTELRAGPMRAILDGIDLRRIEVNGVEIVRRIYVAVRDDEWGTIPPVVDDLRVVDTDGGFEVSFEARHRDGGKGIDFWWRGRYAAGSDGVLECSMAGRCDGAFDYDRIGFCVLNPDDECAGQPYTGEGPDGTCAGDLPLDIGPQPFEDGVYLALFPPVSRLTVGLASGGVAAFHFEGDLFEMEDQRNWTDASFKTYGTPIGLGFPHHATAGEELSQRITIEGVGIPLRSEGAGRDDVVRIEVGDPTGFRLPQIGLGASRPGRSQHGRCTDVLRTYRFDHLRVDLDVAAGDATDVLRQARQTADALDCALEVALHVPGAGSADLAPLGEALAGCRLARLLVFAAGAESATPEETTPPGVLSTVREALGAVLPGVPIGGGTDMQFCELNRTRPAADLMDAVSYAIMPQEHATDDLSLIESLRIQGATVRSAKGFSGDRPIAVSPVTLLPRTDAAGAAGDRRQYAMLGAGWTAGSVKFLAEAGISSITYYEPCGPRGLVGDAGEVAPMCAVFAWLARWKGAEVLTCTSSDELAALGLAVRAAPGLGPQLLVANLTAEPLRVEVGPYDGEGLLVRSLSAPGPSARPRQAVGNGRFASLPLADRIGVVALEPYGLAWVGPASPGLSA